MNEKSQDYYTNSHHSLFYDEPNTTQNQLIENVKIFDGFYLGNVYSGGDQEFISNNKIGLIINCQPLELKIEAIPFVRVLSYNFHTRRGQIQESLHMTVFSEIVSSIDDFLSKRHEGVLMVSINMDSRCVCLGMGYLMVKYGWSMQETLHFIRGRKHDIEIADKYTQILNNLEKNPQKSKISQSLSGIETESHAILLKNTLANSQTNSTRNFHGLCYKRTERQPSIPHHQHKVIRFVDQIQIIHSLNSKNQNSDQQKQPFTFAKEVQASICCEIVKQEAKLNAAQMKLKRFIKQKCNPNHYSGHIEPRVGFELPGEEPLTFIKAKDKIARRRAASRTEESVVYDQEEPFTKVKRNNFLGESIKSKIAGVEQLFKKKTITETITEGGRLKSLSQNYSKSQLAKRGQNDMTQSSEYSQQDISKINTMFKISKSNKSSHKKIRSDQPYRPKGYQIRPHQKHLQPSNTAATASQANFIPQASYKLNQKKMSADGKNNPARVSSQNRGGHHTADQNYESEEHLRTEKKQINKLKCRILPKRVIRPGTFQ